MTPDDPRHGSEAGYNQETKDGNGTCKPCRTAHAINQNRRRYDNATGRARILPAIGARRRIEALQALGWSLRMIANKGAWGSPQALSDAIHGDTMHRGSWLRVADVYERLCMTVPPKDSATVRAKNRARRLKYAPPLAWDDIDDPDEQPNYGTRARTQGTNAAVDQSLVARVLAGENLWLNTNERREVMARWIARGGTETGLCKRMDWRHGRYTPRKDDAA